MANKGNSDAMQQQTDSRSDPGHDTKEKSESSSEPEEKQTGPSGDSLPDNASKEDDEKTTQIRSSFETEKHPHSGTEPKRDMDREKGSKPERKEGPSGDSLPDNASKEDDEKTTQIHSSSETENHPHSGTEPKRNMDREKGGKPERKEGPSGDSLPDNASKEDNEKTTQIRSSSETEKHPHSGTEPKRDMDREKGSKPERKEGPSGDSLPDNASKEDDEKTTQIPSSSETEKHPHSGTEPKRDMDREKGGKPERKEGPSGDSLPDNASKEDDEKTTQIPSSFETEKHPHSGTEPKRDMDREKGGKPERKEGPSGDSLPDNAPKEDDEKTTQIHSSFEIEKHPHSGTEPKRDMDREKGGKPERKEGPSGDSLPDNASKEDDEKTTQIRSSSETEKHPHSGTEPKKDMDREKGSKHERKEESPLNIQKPEEEDTASDIHEDVKRDENVQPQIIVPVNNKIFWTAAAVILLAVLCALCQRSPDSTPPIPKEVNVVDVFNQEMKKLETTFLNQHPELWRRSLIHLRRHLKTKNPTEPVSLILTSDHRAEKTLGCLAQCLARAFSTTHNTSVLNINGKDKASQDSVQVKLDIDSELKKAFEGKKSAAVIHHFEELPPGSTLIFYRYCDHENAAYKDVFLVFTVMLDPDVELTSNVSLGRVEEMVQEHIKQKFVSSDKSAMFNQMDVDKLGGLWSRISHLILPVAAEKKIEEQGCGDCGKSF